MVIALTSLQALMAIATKRDMEIKQLNVNSAFLYGDLDKEINLEQPKDFQVNGTNGKKLVCKLCKAIYGLKQVERVWWKLIDSKIKDLEFKSYTKEVCAYN